MPLITNFFDEIAVLMEGSTYLRVALVRGFTVDRLKSCETTSKPLVSAGILMMSSFLASIYFEY